MKARIAKKIMRKVLYAEIRNNLSAHIWMYPRRNSVKRIRLSYSSQQIKEATKRIDLSGDTPVETMRHILGKRNKAKLANVQSCAMEPFGLAGLLIGMLMMPLCSGFGGFDSNLLNPLLNELNDTINNKKGE